MLNKICQNSLSNPKLRRYIYGVPFEISLLISISQKYCISIPAHIYSTLSIEIKYFVLNLSNPIYAHLTAEKIS